mmetsp:Transcript_4489/g.9748  ORF Transcript_4489/g.9748 Transcript_4489/m.9748 type:complete len:202 (-) Transcript_4489:492-1097(-)
MLLCLLGCPNFGFFAVVFSCWVHLILFYRRIRSSIRVTFIFHFCRRVFVQMLEKRHWNSCCCIVIAVAVIAGIFPHIFPLWYMSFHDPLNVGNGTQPPNKPKVTLRGCCCRGLVFPLLGSLHELPYFTGAAFGISSNIVLKDQIKVSVLCKLFHSDQVGKDACQNRSRPIDCLGFSPEFYGIVQFDILLTSVPSLCDFDPL